MSPSDQPLRKRLKLESAVKATDKNDENQESALLPRAFKICQALLATTSACPTPSLPTSLTNITTKNDLEKLRKLFDDHGFRTSVVMSPRPALSIYKDSCKVSSCDTPYLAGKESLLTMLGMHPEQNDIERWYAVSVKQVYCLALFCNLLRIKCPQAMETGSVDALLTENETICRSLGVSTGKTTVEEVNHLSSLVSERVAALIKAVVAADSRLRSEQLQHEFDRLTYRNSTMSNAVVQLFLHAHNCSIKDVYFKRSHLEKYERITVYLYDPQIDEIKPPRFTFLPSLHRALEDGPAALVQDMIQSFWGHLLRHGYFATSATKSEFTPDLEKYFLSGIAQDPTIPLLL